MPTVTMTLEEYEALTALIRAGNGANMVNGSTATEIQGTTAMEKPKKRNTAYTRKYKKMFKKVQNRYKLKSGKWKKGGFRKAVKEAHRMARK